MKRVLLGFFAGIVFGTIVSLTFPVAAGSSDALQLWRETNRYLSNIERHLEKMANK